MEQETCANCGKIYGHHTDTGYCFEGQSDRWFPGSVADAIVKARQTPPEEPEYPTVEYIGKLMHRAETAELEAERWRTQLFESRKIGSLLMEKFKILEATLAEREKEIERLKTYAEELANEVASKNFQIERLTGWKRAALATTETKEDTKNERPIQDS